MITLLIIPSFLDAKNKGIISDLVISQEENILDMENFLLSKCLKKSFNHDCTQIKLKCKIKSKLGKFQNLIQGKNIEILHD